MLPGDSFPAYVLFIDLDPQQVDVNVHPTKQEIKFEDEKIVYAFIQAAVKHALAQFSITPTLDFELDSGIQSLDSIQKPFTEEKRVEIRSGSMFQTFTEANQAHKVERSEVPFDKLGVSGEWPVVNKEPSSGFMSLTRQLMELDETLHTTSSDLNPLIEREQTVVIPETASLSHISSLTSHFTYHSPLTTHHSPTQLFNTYILAPADDRFYLIHQQAAHERILYEGLSKAMLGKAVATQRSLFPSTIELAPADAVLLTELLPDLEQLGYSIEPFGKNAFVIQGTPADVAGGAERYALEKMLEQYKHFSTELKLPRREMLLRTVAWQGAIKPGTILTEREMESLVTDLFACAQASSSPSGRPTYTEFRKEQLDKMFGR